MRVAFFSKEGVTLSWARRLFDEGAEVLVCHASSRARRIGRGIVPLAKSREQWLTWGTVDPRTIWLFDCTDFGELADQLRRSGKLVVGGGSFMDRLENDRAFGERFAERNGMLAPPTQRFGSVRAAIDFIRSKPKQKLGDGGWAWKPDRDLGCEFTFVGDDEQVVRFLERAVLLKKGDRISCIVQERIPGVALSTARWWNGTQWTGPYEGTLEEKKLMNGDVGPSTGCSLNTVWFYHEDQPRIAQALRWEGLAETFRRAQAPPGIYDVNAVVNEQGAYFLEWTPRLGIDADLLAPRAYTSLSQVLERVATGGSIDDLVRIDMPLHDVRLTVPPYPCDAKELALTKIALDASIEGLDSLWHGDFVMVGVQFADGAFSVADPFGFVGLAAVADRSVARGYARIGEAAKSIEVPHLQYRTDGAAIITDDVRAMAKHGWPTTPYLSIEEVRSHAA